MKNFSKIIACILLFSVSTPSFAAAYTPNTEKEYIAYLQGVLDALRINQASEVSSNKIQTDAPKWQSEVVLSASYDIGSQSYVYAWFEYGVGELDKKSTKTKIVRVRSKDEVTHRRTITNLESGVTYSYRAVFENRAGKRSYGALNTFNTLGTTTTIDGGTWGQGGTAVSTSRGSLSVDKTIYKTGDEITVNWSVPKSKVDNSNWIGLFKTSAKNSDYTRWSYLSDDTEGEETFRLSEAGTYEIRLFYNNSYKDEVTSRKITVTKK